MEILEIFDEPIRGPDYLAVVDHGFILHILSNEV